MTGKKRKKERQEKKKGNDLLSETKQVWESLRKKEMPKNEREELTTRLLELCKGKMMEVITPYLHLSIKIPILQIAILSDSPCFLVPFFFPTDHQQA